MSAQQFEEIARQAERLARQVEQVDTHLRRIGDGAIKVIGGTATGADQAMLGLTHQAAAKARSAMSSLAEASRAARSVAAAEGERERKRSTEERPR